MIKVLIADDQELIRQSLQILLETKPDVKITDAVCNGRDVIRSVRRQRPDVILMDVRMPEMNGIQCTQIIKEIKPEIKIIVLTTFDDDEYVFQSLKHGASGYLLKGISMKTLYDAIHTVYEGNSILAPEIMRKVLDEFARMAKNEKERIPADSRGIAELTENEWRIVQRVSEGLSNREIAEKLSFSEGTVRNYLSLILDKLNLRDRTQLAIWAVQGGLEHKGEAFR